MATNQDPPSYDHKINVALGNFEFMHRGEPVEQSNNSVAWVEQKYPNTMRRYDEILKSNRDLFCSKQSDYGPNNVSMGQNIRDETGRAVSLAALAVRINDKAQRLVNLTMVKPLRGDTQAANHEPIIDSFRDLINYAIMAQIVHSGDWGT